ncbi:MAG: hypothetical protein WCO75_04220 [Planctomycetota bacterium]
MVLFLWPCFCKSAPVRCPAAADVFAALLRLDQRGAKLINLLLHPRLNHLI